MADVLEQKTNAQTTFFRIYTNSNNNSYQSAAYSKSEVKEKVNNTTLDYMHTQ
jgi:hypothetical protein